MYEFRRIWPQILAAFMLKNLTLWKLKLHNLMNMIWIRKTWAGPGWLLPTITSINSNFKYEALTFSLSQLLVMNFNFLTINLLSKWNIWILSSIINKRLIPWNWICYSSLLRELTQCQIRANSHFTMNLRICFCKLLQDLVQQ